MQELKQVNRRGEKADIILVDTQGEVPADMRTFVSGNEVYRVYGSDISSILHEPFIKK